MTRLLLALLLATALAGCLESDPEGDGVTILGDVTLAGIVEDKMGNPIEGATITLTGPGTVYSDGKATEDVHVTTVTTDANGNFTLEDPPGNRHLLVEAEGFHAIERNVVLPQTAMELTMTPINVNVPYSESFDFDGEIQCAVEAFIITPSCDTLLKEGSEDAALFTDDSIFEITTPTGWQTIVLDVQFDVDAQPGFDGIRTSAYAADANAEVFDYQRINQASATGPYTLRIDAGADYGDAVAAPSSEGGHGIRFEFYPHGHADDTVCIPEQAPELHPSAGPGRCFLGAGVGQDVTFTATATLFVHAPAPSGWTTLGN